MFTIACLETAIVGTKWDPPPLRSPATDIEFCPLWVKIDSAEPTAAHPLEDPQEFIRKAGGFYLRSHSIIGDAACRGEITRQISSGKRLLASLDPNEDRVRSVNLFLEKYGIKGTTIGILRRDEDAPDVPPWFFPARDWPQDFELIRDVDAACFRDAALFNGVHSLKLSSPLLIEYGGRAFPTLVLPEKGSGLIDKVRDLPADWTARELACVVSFYEQHSQGAVLAYSGSLFADSLMGFNKAFASNLLRWLKQGAQNEPSPVDLVRQIEENLLITLQSILGRNFEDWWRTAVPEAIRVECSARQERAKTILPKHAYLDLLDYKRIIEYNWNRFEAALCEVGWKGGKQKALAWLDRLNDIRNIVAHPTRAYFSGPLSRDDRAFLDECFSRVLRMSTHRPPVGEQG